MIVVPQVAFRAEQVAAGDAAAPLLRVRELARAGATQVQLLDLDGTLGDTQLPSWLDSLIAVSAVPIRIDARLHAGDAIERFARTTCSSIIVDQSAVFDALLLRWALDLLGDRLVVELQLDGDYLFDPPPAAFGIDVIEALGAMHFQGVRRVLLRDVTGEHAPLRQLLTIANRHSGMRLTYVGAVRSVTDIADIASVGPCVEAVVVAADYIDDGRINLAAANLAAGAA